MRAAAPSPRVSIIVAPRERFSCTQVALESLFEHTGDAAELIYVDGNSPAHIRDYLREQAASRGFNLLREERYLSPNQARNLGLAQAHGELLVFIDNDVVVTPGWLDALVACADETGADIVAPTYFIGEPEQRIIHMAGGVFTRDTQDGKLSLREQHRFINQTHQQVASGLRREPVDFVEFHCMLVRASVFAAHGPLDEDLLSLHEHLDICLQVTGAGGQVCYEPAAEVTYLAKRVFQLCDVEYFLLRWCDDWNRRSKDHFQRKWDLADTSPMLTRQHHWLNKHQQQLQIPVRREAGATPLPQQIAQTNIQLYSQCISLGYSETDLARIRHAYEFAQLCFPAAFRGNGKHFLAHLIGTASLLAHYGAPTDLVIAGLLHSLYDFGDLRHLGLADAQAIRQSVARLLGQRTEHLLLLYKQFVWDAASAGRIAENLHQLPLPLAKVLLIRICNDLEESFDASLSYCNKSAAEIREWRAVFQGVAQRLCIPELHAALTHYAALADEVQPPAALVSSNAASYVLDNRRQAHSLRKRTVEQG